MSECNDHAWYKEGNYIVCGLCGLVDRRCKGYKDTLRKKGERNASVFIDPFLK